MAHSHENTYIANLGFRDPDRNTTKHDLACEYISREDNIRKIALKFGKEFVGSSYDKERIKVLNEEPINQESGSFKRTVGFVDVFVEATIPTGRSRESKDGKTGYEYKYLYAMIEVKIAPMSIPTIIRQLKFYKTYQHLTYPSLILATMFPITHEEGELLDREGIHHIILGESFTKYCDERKDRHLERNKEDEKRMSETLVL